MNKKIVYPIAVIVVGMALAYLIAVNEPSPPVAPYERVPVSVRVITVKAGAEYLAISSQGTVQPRTQSELIPEVTGRVNWMSPALIGGGSFVEGEALLRIDDADYKTAAQRTTAARERTRIEEDFAADELVRLQSLYGKQLASQSQLDGAERAASVARANLAEASAALDQAQRDLSRTELIAPFDGLVRAERVDVGQFITRGQSFGTIYATDYMEVRLPIASDQLLFLGISVSRQGMIPEGVRPQVVLSADFGKARVLWEGEMVRTEAEIDAQSRMLYAVTRVRADASEGRPVLPVGLFVQADIRGRQVDNIIRLPRSVIRDSNEVLVVNEDHRLEFRQVSILRLEHDDVLIDGGLEDGEMVCVSPMQTVVEGMSVQPVFE